MSYVYIAIAAFAVTLLLLWFAYQMSYRTMWSKAAGLRPLTFWEWLIKKS